MQREVWKPLVGFEEAYEVSSVGRVRSVNRVVEFRNGQVRKYLGKVIRPTTSGDNGYLQVNCRVAGVATTVRVHVAVAAAFIGEKPTGRMVLHKDGKPTNNTVENLYYGTPKQNTRDRILHGRDMAGERHPSAVLTEVDVELIRIGLSRGEKHKDLADLFDVARTTISAISSGRSWATTMKEAA